VELHSLAVLVAQEMQLILDKMLVFLAVLAEMQVLLVQVELQELLAGLAVVVLLAMQERLEMQVHQAARVAVVEEEALDSVI
jgi:hypothetical protein